MTLFAMYGVLGRGTKHLFMSANPDLHCQTMQLVAMHLGRAAVTEYFLKNNYDIGSSHFADATMFAGVNGEPVQTDAVLVLNHTQKTQKECACLNLINSCLVLEMHGRPKDGVSLHRIVESLFFECAELTV